MNNGRPLTQDERLEIIRKLGDFLNGKQVPGVRLIKKEAMELKRIVMNFLNGGNGRSVPYICGHVVATSEIFQQGIDCMGKNIELSVRKGTALESVLVTSAHIGEKPVVTIKLANRDGVKIFAGGELGWDGDSRLITERGVFDVLEGKLYSYLFEMDVREKLMGLFREYAAKLK